MQSCLAVDLRTWALHGYAEGEHLLKNNEPSVSLHIY